MLNADENEPLRPNLKPVDLQPMSIGELEAYIATLEAEIARAEAMIEKKNAHRSGIDALFGTPKG